MKFILLLLFSITSFSVLADNYEAYAKEMINKKDKIIAPYVKETVEHIKQVAARQDKHDVREFQTWLFDKQKEFEQKILPKNIDANGRVLIFLSFSMADESIIQWIKQANIAHATPVIRGLYQDSLQKTINKMQFIIEQAKGGGIQIDPVAFKAHDIKSAPTVLVIDEKNNIDKISGDISLQYALKKIYADGDTDKSLVEEYINRLGDA